MTEQKKTESTTEHVTRSETHRIDTLATRTVLINMPPDWLVRSLEERDYGVNMQIELFDDRRPTGQTAMVQIKGTEGSLPEAPSLGNFPVKTLNYAMLFPQPFFLFRVSIESRTTHFVWLQKYVRAKLDQENPNWRKQGSVTIHFPAENELAKSGDKVEEIILNHRFLAMGVEFLGIYERLETHVGHLSDNSDLPGLARVCAKLVGSLSRIEEFVEKYSMHGQLNLPAFKTLLITLANDPDGLDEYQTEIDDHMNNLSFVKMGFLHKEETEELNRELSGQMPY